MAIKTVGLLDEAMEEDGILVGKKSD
jgi:hypothetical protein